MYMKNICIFIVYIHVYIQYIYIYTLYIHIYIFSQGSNTTLSKGIIGRLGGLLDANKRLSKLNS